MTAGKGLRNNEQVKSCERGDKRGKRRAVPVKCGSAATERYSLLSAQGGLVHSSYPADVRRYQDNRGHLSRRGQSGKTGRYIDQFSSINFLNRINC
jgi:hypothetical protein